jgi:flagellar protein FliS
MENYAAYKENEILTQPPEKLIVLLYEGAIRFLKRAAAAMEAGNHEEKAKYLNKAQAIIDELNVSLDMEAGGEVAENLRRLYVFMYTHLSQAVTKQDPQMIRDVIACLEDLNEGWRAVSS